MRLLHIWWRHQRWLVTICCTLIWLVWTSGYYGGFSSLNQRSLWRMTLLKIRIWLCRVVGIVWAKTFVMLRLTIGGQIKGVWQFYGLLIFLLCRLQGFIRNEALLVYRRRVVRIALYGGLLAYQFSLSTLHKIALEDDHGAVGRLRRKALGWLVRVLTPFYCGGRPLRKGIILGQKWWMNG